MILNWQITRPFSYVRMGGYSPWAPAAGLPPRSVLRPVTGLRRVRRGSVRVGAFLAPPPVLAIFAHVNGGTGTHTTTAASLSYTTTWTVAAGDLLLVGVSAHTSSSLTFSCSDGMNTYVQDAIELENSNTYAVLFRSLVTTGGILTIVITPSASNYLSMAVDEYSIQPGYTFGGLDGSVATGGGGSTSQTTGNLSPATVGLIYGVSTGLTNNIGTLTAGSGFTPRYNYSPSSFSAVPILCEDIVANATSPIAVTSTSSATSNWAIVGAAYMATPIPPLRQASPVRRPPTRPMRGSAMIASQTIPALAILFPSRTIISRPPTGQRRGHARVASLTTTKTSVAVPYIHLFGGSNAGLDL